MSELVTEWVAERISKGVYKGVSGCWVRKWGGEGTNEKRESK